MFTNLIDTTVNNFGGNWTEIKIEILVEYASAYLLIMARRKYYKLLYFDGFAGSGFIVKDDKKDVQITVGAARRIIELDDPRPFDEYYFVEKEARNFELLKKHTKDEFPDKLIYATQDDCNKKLLDMANFLSKPSNRNYRTLAYIDPCGMQVEWESIQALKGLNIDVWVLVPTGLGVNRLLTRSGYISEAWIERLEKFLGMNKNEILAEFYTESPTLFPDIIDVKKESDAIRKSGFLYQKKLNEVFNFVSNPFELRNSSNSIMYHLFLASNNKTAIKIGNDIVNKHNS